MNLVRRGLNGFGRRGRSFRGCSFGGCNFGGRSFGGRSFGGLNFNGGRLRGEPFGDRDFSCLRLRWRDLGRNDFDLRYIRGGGFGRRSLRWRHLRRHLERGHRNRRDLKAAEFRHGHFTLVRRCQLRLNADDDRCHHSGNHSRHGHLKLARRGRTGRLDYCGRCRGGNMFGSRRRRALRDGLLAEMRQGADALRRFARCGETAAHRNRFAHARKLIEARLQNFKCRERRRHDALIDLHDERLKLVGKIPHKLNARHARTALQGVQRPLQRRTQLGVGRIRTPGRKRALSGFQKLGRLFGKDAGNLRIELRPGIDRRAHGLLSRTRGGGDAVI